MQFSYQNTSDTRPNYVYLKPDVVGYSTYSSSLSGTALNYFKGKTNNKWNFTIDVTTSRSSTTHTLPNISMYATQGSTVDMIQQQVSALAGDSAYFKHATNKAGTWISAADICNAIADAGYSGTSFAQQVVLCFDWLNLIPGAGLGETVLSYHRGKAYDFCNKNDDRFVTIQTAIHYPGILLETWDSVADHSDINYQTYSFTIPSGSNLTKLTKVSTTMDFGRVQNFYYYSTNKYKVFVDGISDFRFVTVTGFNGNSASPN